jgi:hypothetical protein
VLQKSLFKDDLQAALMLHCPTQQIDLLLLLLLLLLLPPAAVAVAVAVVVTIVARMLGCFNEFLTR